MARPTKRTYLAVLAAFLIIGGVGGYLAANWRGLAAAYYLRKAADLKADYATVRDALAKARHYDRARVVAFWRREMEEINRLEEKSSRPDEVYVTFRMEKYVLDEGEGIRIEAVIHNPTDKQVEVFTRSESLRHCKLSAWAANRRSPDSWEEPVTRYSPISARAGPDNIGRVAPHGEAHEEFDFLKGGAAAGFYRIHVSWGGQQGRMFSVRTLVVRVIPKGDEPEPTSLPMPMWGGATDRGGSDW